MAQIKNNPLLLDNTIKLFGVRDNVPGEVVPGFLGVHNLLHVQDQKAQNTTGGSFASGAWRTRDLNSVITNNISGASLSSNQITLPDGKYYCEAYAPAAANTDVVNGTRIRIHNVGASTQLLLGRTCFVGSGSTISFAFTSCEANGVFDLDVESTIELQHICSVTSPYAYAMGPAGNVGGVEIFSDLKIWKIA